MASAGIAWDMASYPELKNMRVVLSCLQSLQDHPISSYKHWRTYFVNGFAEAGIECVEVPNVDWVEGIVQPAGEKRDEWRSQTWERTLSFVRHEHARQPISFFLGYLYPQMVDATAIKELQRIGIPCVNFFCDNVREFREVPSEFQHFDLHWVPEYQAVEMYRRAGLKYLHAAMPCWVPPAQRTCDHPETEGATFIGSPDELRRALLGQAIESGAEINIYGAGWNGEQKHPCATRKDCGKLLANQWRDITTRGVDSWLYKFERRFRPLPQPPAIPLRRLCGKLSPDDFVRVMQQSAVAIGINRVTVHYRSLRRPITYSRLRDIEAPMMGACYLTEWAEDLEHLYEVGKEIEIYRTAEELKEKLETLRKNPGRRREMRRLAQARALNEHSVAASLLKIGRELGVRAG